jgi:hypothetical protein
MDVHKIQVHGGFGNTGEIMKKRNKHRGRDTARQGMLFLFDDGETGREIPLPLMLATPFFAAITPFRR